MDRKIIISTDGSASIKAKNGGWGFVVRYAGQSITRSGRADGTTISVMELTAIQRALRFLNATDIPVAIYSDSKYALNAIGQWGDVWEKESWITSTGKHVSHVPLIKDIRALVALHRSIRTVELEWIKGHAGHEDNHIADELAGKARREPKTVTWTSADWKFHTNYKEKYGQHDTAASAV